MLIFTKLKLLNQQDRSLSDQFAFLPKYAAILAIAMAFSWGFSASAIAGAFTGNASTSTAAPGKKNYSFVLKGTVIDENDETLPGASIRVKGTTNGAVTDVNGKFIIEIGTEQDSIVVSFIGYKSKTLMVGNRKTITVKLEPDGKQLDDVQVVGYGTQKKANLVGSVSSVSVSEIQKFSTPALSNAIGGKLAGVMTRQSSGQVGYDAASVFIRGQISMTGSNKPLVVIDGIERELNDYWTNLSVQEIESFSVLKDASATAVYGSRGANGVILINTKRGKLGRPQINFRAESAIAKPMRIEDNINSFDYATLINENRIRSNRPLAFSDEQLQKYKDGSDPYLYPNVDWYDLIFRKRTFQSINNLSVSGGSEAVKYYVKLGYTNQQGDYNEEPGNIYKTNASLNRYSFRSNVDIALSKNIEMKVGLSAIISSNNYPALDADGVLFYLKLTNPLVMPLINPDGSNPGATGDLIINPWTKITKSGYTRQSHNITTSDLSLDWNLSSITPGLSVRTKASFDVVDITQNVREQSPDAFRYEIVNGVPKYTRTATATALGFRNLYETYRTMYGELGLNYERAFGKHSVSGLLLGNKKETQSVAAGNSLDNLPERRLGLISRVTYGYDSRYLLELNGGYTGSENFIKGKQFGFFPSVGAGWIVSNEKFWNKDVISTFKLRGSYGVVGNDRIGSPLKRFLFLSNFNKSALGYQFGSAQTYNPSGVSEARIGNPDVTWETAYKSNAGIDLELFNGKITLTADVFHERREDQLLERKVIPAYTGYPGSTIPFANVGTSTNKGIEGSLNLRNTTKSGFFYSFIGNFSFAKSEVIENDEPAPLYPWQELRGYGLGANLGYVALGLFKDAEDVANSPTQVSLAGSPTNYGPGDIKYKDINGDNQITAADRTVIGLYSGSFPQIMYGFGGTFGWKGFDASIFFTGAANRDFFYNGGFTSWAFQGAEGLYNVQQNYFDQRWIPGAENTDAKYPGIRAQSSNNYVISTLWKESGNYLRIKNAEIGYKLPAGLTKRISINSARIFINGTNLATWDQLKVIDPESDFGSGRHPIKQTYNFGLEVTF
jgi:TonB-linked SusC/RagA family outer membrane protein